MHNPLRLLSNDLDARSSQLSLPMKRKELELPDCHSRTHMRFTLPWVVPEHELGKIWRNAAICETATAAASSGRTGDCRRPCVPEFADRRGDEELIHPLTPMMSQGRGSLLG